MKRLSIALAAVVAIATVATAGDNVIKIGNTNAKSGNRLTARVDQVTTNGFLSANWYIDKTRDGFPVPSVAPTQFSNSVIIVLVDPLNVHSGQTWRGMVDLQTDTSQRGKTAHQTWRAVK